VVKKTMVLKQLQMSKQKPMGAQKSVEAQLGEGVETGGAGLVGRDAVESPGNVSPVVEGGQQKGEEVQQSPSEELEKIHELIEGWVERQRDEAMLENGKGTVPDHA
jgi:hypothetical protein